MAKNQKSTKISRRSVLQRVDCAVVSTPIILATPHAAMAARMSHASVGYRDLPNGSQSGANCDRFIPPFTCSENELHQRPG